ncbi:SymE family type I addiction module toxin [Rahnella sp. AA]|uniref:SymE family type I addiction module toxin n=1 Tax=Rahnella sp. AA TaxID=2057180 RepID=UPI003510EFE6
MRFYVRPRHTPCPPLHRYTVGYHPNGGRPNSYPQLTVKDKWLKELGSSTGQQVSITTEDGCLVIRAEIGG